MDARQVTADTIIAAQSGDRDAMWEIVSAYDDVLTATARTVAPKATPDQLDDLHQEARAILIQHVQAFDTDAHTAALTTFAHHAVRRGIARAWVEMTTGVTVEPDAALAVRRALHRAEGDVEDAWEIVSASSDERRRMSRGTFMAIMEALGETVSLDEPAPTKRAAYSEYAGGCARGAVADTISDPDADFTDSTARRDLARALLRQIPQRQAFALRAYYGVEMTRLDDHEAALDLGVKPATLRHLRTDGLKSARRVAAVRGIAA